MAFVETATPNRFDPTAPTPAPPDLGQSIDITDVIENTRKEVNKLVEDFFDTYRKEDSDG